MMLDVDLFAIPTPSEARAVTGLPGIFLTPFIGLGLAGGRGCLHLLEPLVVCVLFLHGVGSSAQRCNKFKKN